MDTSGNDVATMTPEQLVSFKKIMYDMMRDLITTFPELENELDKDLYNLWKQVSEPDVIDKSAEQIFKYCVKVFPPCLLDILYQNEEMFTNTEINTHFLPGINYRTLMHENISVSTRNTIWKYLQLILFSTVSNTSAADSFGDAADMFKSINKDEFKSKLDETLNDMKNLFSTVDDASGGGGPHINPDNIPSAEKIQESMASLMEGKLGSLAREIADETVADFSGNMGDASNVGEVFSNLMKDPTKLMNMVKNVGTKLDTKIKSGEIKESELLSEASEMMRKMKEMPGMDNMEEMLKKMGLGGKGKINHGAMQSMMDRNMKMSRQKERMKARIGKPVSTPKCADTTEKSAENSMESLISEIENEKVFRCGPNAERSSASDKKKKKKKKK